MMKILHIDEKWSIMYDSTSNDKPVSWYRYGEYNSEFIENNAVVSLFYAMLSKSE